MDPAGSQEMGKFTVGMDTEEQGKAFSGSYSDFPGKHGQPLVWKDKDAGFSWPAGPSS